MQVLMHFLLKLIELILVHVLCAELSIAVAPMRCLLLADEAMMRLAIFHHRQVHLLESSDGASTGCTWAPANTDGLLSARTCSYGGEDARCSLDTT